MLFLGKEFSDGAVVALTPHPAAFCLESKPANHCSERCGSPVRDVQRLLAFA